MAGSGPPLLLLHGILTDGRTWGRELDRFADRFTVVAWDGPGCGRSDDLPAGAGLADHALALSRFIDVLGLGRPHVLGLSWGAVLALELSRIRPDLPRSMILVSAYAGWSGSLPPSLVDQRLAAALAGIRDTSPDAVAQAWLPTLFTARARPEVVRWIGSIMADFHHDAAPDMLRALAGADLRDVLPTIRVPTLLVHGEQDTRAPMPVARALERAIPGARLEVIPAAGHLPNLGSPDRFDAVVSGFLASLTGLDDGAAAEDAVRPPRRPTARHAP
jgi:pimeloyl-ACP methyl ester carboxylesterase